MGILSKISYTIHNMKQCDTVRQLIDDSGFQTSLSTLGFFVMNLGTGKTLPSSLWLALGYNNEPMIGQNILKFVHPEDAGPLAADMEDLLAGHRDELTRTFRVQRQDASWIWLEVSYSVLCRLPDGRAEVVLGHDQDVDAIKRAEQESRDRLEELETIRQVTRDLCNSQIGRAHV